MTSEGNKNILEEVGIKTIHISLTHEDVMTAASALATM